MARYRVLKETTVNYTNPLPPYEVKSVTFKKLRAFEGDLQDDPHQTAQGFIPKVVVTTIDGKMPDGSSATVSIPLANLFDLHSSSGVKAITKEDLVKPAPLVMSKYSFRAPYTAFVSMAGYSGQVAKAFSVGDVYEGAPVTGGIKLRIAPAASAADILAKMSNQEFLVVPAEYLIQVSDTEQPVVESVPAAAQKDSSGSSNAILIAAAVIGFILLVK